MVLWGIIIAIGIYPIFRKLSTLLGERDKLATTIITMTMLAILIVPSVLLIDSTIDGIQGIAMCKENNFDMVFTDLGMPGMNGWQVAQEVKKKNRKIPVALITGWTIQLKQRELKNKGVDFLVSKPFKMDQILQLVQTIQDKGNA